VQNSGNNKQLDKIRYPRWRSTAIYILSVIVLAIIAIQLDGSKMIAYAIMPVLFFRAWCSDANIRWDVSKKGTIVACVIGFMWVIVGWLFIS
jgi:hypothetical protein